MTEDVKIPQEEEKKEEPKKQKKSSNFFLKFLFFILFLTFGLAGSVSWWYPYVSQEYKKFLPKVEIASKNYENKQDFSKLKQKISLLEEEIKNKKAIPYDKVENVDQLNLPTDIKEKIVQLEAKIKEKTLRLDEIENKLSSIKNEKSSKKEILEERLVSLEMARQKLTDKIEEITSKQSAYYGKAEDKISMLDRAKADNKDVLGLVNKVSENEKELKRLTAKSDDAIIELLAINQLKDAIVTGKSFVQEYESLKAISKGNKEIITKIKKLEDYKQEGILTLPELQTSYKKIAAKAEWATHEVPYDGWLGQTLKELKKYIIIRKVDTTKQEEQTTAAYLTNAENYLNKKDIKNAISQLEKITDDNANQVIKDWKESAKARLKADNVLSEITAYMLAVIKANKLKGR